jgi:hypothetical protein
MSHQTKTVKLSSIYDAQALHRQTPGGHGRWGSYQFSKVGERAGKADYWFVLDNLGEPETTTIRSGKAVLICHEPPDIKNYHPGFLRQFDVVVSCHKGFRHPNVMYRQQGLPWLAGSFTLRGPADHYDAVAELGYDDFAAMPRPAKPRKLSTITSNIAKVRGHRKRQQFMELMQQAIPELDVYGRGRNPVADKKDALLPYTFHLALENSAVDHYWTEKLADSYLCHAFPIYYGAPNLADYFPPDSFLAVDIARPRDAVAKIRQLLDNGLNDRQLAAMAEARDLVLNKYNAFALMANICDELESKADRQPASPVTRTLLPEKQFRGYRVLQAMQRVQRWTKARLP